MSGYLPTERYAPASSNIPLVASIAEAKSGEDEMRLRLMAGRPFRYRIALTNRTKRPFRFKNCPVYLEGLASMTQQERHVLNCEPVRTISPGERVLFEMVLHVPVTAPAGNNGLSWELGQKTAQPSPFAAAAAVVSR
jgi:hypothetical protein